jgi:hypothetical protein
MMQQPQAAYGGQAPTGFGQYEFNQAENQVIGKAGGRIFTWGMIQTIMCALGLLLGLFTLVMGVVALAGGTAAPLINGFILLLETGLGLYLGILYLKAGSALKGVVNTQGNDIPLLMGALSRLGTTFFVQTIIFILAIVLGLLGAILVFVVFAAAVGSNVH